MTWCRKKRSFWPCWRKQWDSLLPIVYLNKVDATSWGCLPDSVYQHFESEVREKHQTKRLTRGSSSRVRLNASGARKSMAWTFRTFRFYEFSIKARSSKRILTVIKEWRPIGSLQMIEFHFVRRWSWKGKKSVQHTWLLLPPTSVIYTSELTPPFSTTKWCSSTLTVCKRARMISAKGQEFRTGVSVKKNTYNPWASNQVSRFALRRSWNWEIINKQQQRPDH